MKAIKRKWYAFKMWKAIISMWIHLALCGRNVCLVVQGNLQKWVVNLWFIDIFFFNSILSCFCILNKHKIFKSIRKRTIFRSNFCDRVSACICMPVRLCEWKKKQIHQCRRKYVGNQFLPSISMLTAGDLDHENIKNVTECLRFILVFY